MEVFEKTGFIWFYQLVSKVVIAMALIKAFDVDSFMIGTIARLAFIIYGKL